MMIPSGSLVSVGVPGRAIRTVRVVISVGFAELAMIGVAVCTGSALGRRAVEGGVVRSRRNGSGGSGVEVEIAEKSPKEPGGGVKEVGLSGSKAPSRSHSGFLYRSDNRLGIHRLAVVCGRMQAPVQGEVRARFSAKFCGASFVFTIDAVLANASRRYPGYLANRSWRVGPSE